MVDPQRLAQDVRVATLLTEFRTVNWDHLGATELAEAEANLIAALCATHLDALAAGEEGLDWTDAAMSAEGNPPGLFEEALNAALDRQHRAIVGALRQKLAAQTQMLASAERCESEARDALLPVMLKLAAAEARVQELERELIFARGGIP